MPCNVFCATLGTKGIDCIVLHEKVLCNGEKRMSYLNSPHYKICSRVKFLQASAIVKPYAKVHSLLRKNLLPQFYKHYQGYDISQLTVITPRICMWDLHLKKRQKHQKFTCSAFQEWSFWFIRKMYATCLDLDKYVKIYSISRYAVFELRYLEGQNYVCWHV